jgi:hypothetical protein
LHNEKLRDIYSLPNMIKVIKPSNMKWVGHVARMEKGNPDGKKTLERPRRRWGDNVKTILKE